jgi:hypothetical protein
MTGRKELAHSLVGLERQSFLAQLRQRVGLDLFTAVPAEITVAQILAQILHLLEAQLDLFAI